VLPLQRFWGGNGPREYVYPRIKLPFAHSAVNSPNRSSPSRVDPYEGRTFLRENYGVRLPFLRHGYAWKNFFSLIHKGECHVLVLTETCWLTIFPTHLWSVRT